MRCPECSIVLGVTGLKPWALPLLSIIKFVTLLIKRDFMTIKKQKIIICVYLLFDNTAILLTMTSVASQPQCHVSPQFA